MPDTAVTTDQGDEINPNLIADVDPNKFVKRGGSMTPAPDPAPNVAMPVPTAAPAAVSDQPSPLGPVLKKNWYDLTRPAGPGQLDPSYAHASTDPNTGQPVVMNPSLTKLGKLLTVIRAAGAGAASAAGSPNGGGFGGGYLAAQQNQNEQINQYQQQRMQAANLQMLPFVKAAQIQKMRLEPQLTQSEIDKNKASAAYAQAGVGKRGQVSLEQDYANSVQDAVDNGRDPQTDPDVQQRLAALKAKQKPAAPTTAGIISAAAGDPPQGATYDGKTYASPEEAHHAYAQKQFDLLQQSKQTGTSAVISAAAGPAPHGTTFGGQTYASPELAQQAYGKAQFKLLQQLKQSGGSQATPDQVKLLADGVEQGLQPPDLKGLGRGGAAAGVRAELQKRGFNLANAQSDWTATQKYLSALNSGQQVRFQQNVRFADEALNKIDTLYQRWQDLAPTSGFKSWNRAALVASKAVPGEMGATAQALETQIADVTAELANVYMGGNSPTDKALDLAGHNLSADWNQETFEKLMKQAHDNIRMRANSVSTGHPQGIANSPYSPGNTTTPPPAAPNNPAKKTFGIPIG